MGERRRKSTKVENRNCTKKKREMKKIYRRRKRGKKR